MSQLNQRKMSPHSYCWGGAAWTGCGGELGASSSTVADSTGYPSSVGLAPLQPPPESPPSWSYTVLDPKEIPDHAYRMYPDATYSYAVFGSVLTTLAGRTDWRALSLLPRGDDVRRRRGYHR